jgi:hypothetical protein
MANFVDEHMDVIRQLSVDALVGTGWAKNSKEAWLAYFWAEASNDLNRDKFYAYREWYLDFFNHMYELPGPWTNPSKARPLAEGIVLQKRREWSQANDAILLKMMEACLFTGFNRFRGSFPDGLPRNDASYQMVKFCEGYGKNKLVKFVWRGEDRSLDQISQVGGVFPKACSDYRPPDADRSYITYAEQCNMREPWHPFSIPAIRNDYWFRLTSSDNCTESVVSVTPDPKSALTFPRLGDKGIPSDLVPPIPSLFAGHPVGGQQVSRLSGKIATNAGQVDGLAIKYADKVQIYLCLIEKYFDTAASQQERHEQGLSEKEKFPEWAVKEIPAADIIGSMSFVRVFKSMSDDDGFTVFYLPAESHRSTYTRVRDRYAKSARDMKLIKQLVCQAQTSFREAESLHLHSMKWTGTGAVELHPALNNLRGFSGAGASGNFSKISRIEKSTGANNYLVLWQGV